MNSSLLSKIIPAAAILALSFAGIAGADPVVTFDSSAQTSSVAGAVTNDFSTFALGNATQTFGDATYTFSGNSQIIAGSADGINKEPYSGSGNYLTTGTSTVTITFANAIDYFGLYWGSIDDYNTLSFYKNASDTTAEFSIVGGTNPVISANGSDSGFADFLAASGDSWSKIVLTSSQFAFETDNHAYREAGANTPEPANMMLLGLGGLLMGAGLVYRRRRAIN